MISTSGAILVSETNSVSPSFDLSSSISNLKDSSVSLSFTFSSLVFFPFFSFRSFSFFSFGFFSFFSFFSFDFFSLFSLVFFSFFLSLSSVGKTFSSSESESESDDDDDEEDESSARLPKWTSLSGKSRVTDESGNVPGSCSTMISTSGAILVSETKSISPCFDLSTSKSNLKESSVSLSFTFSSLVFFPFFSFGSFSFFCFGFFSFFSFFSFDFFSLFSLVFFSFFLSLSSVGKTFSSSESESDDDDDDDDEEDESSAGLPKWTSLSGKSRVTDESGNVPGSCSTMIS